MTVEAWAYTTAANQECDTALRMAVEWTAFVPKRGRSGIGAFNQRTRERLYGEDARRVLKGQMQQRGQEQHGQRRVAQTAPGSTRVERTQHKQAAKLTGKTITSPIANEPTVPPPCPPCHEYKPDPTPPEGGVAKAARVGVPAFAVPPPPRKIPRLPNLTKTERAVESRFAAAFENDPDGVTQAYTDMVMKGPKPGVFNTDDAKLLSDYNPHWANRDVQFDAMSRLNTAVHQTANAIAKRAFVKYLDAVVAKLPPDKRKVLVTSGGVASGKGYSLGKVAQARALRDQCAATWDAAGEQNATENPWIMHECAKRGIRPVFMFVHANPEETWTNPNRGVVQRAGNEGRMVDARVFADSYAHGAKNFHNFHQQHKDGGKADFIIIDSSGKEPQLKNAVPEHALSIDAEELYAKASSHLQALEGKVKPAILAGGLAGQRIWGK